MPRTFEDNLRNTTSITLAQELAIPSGKVAGVKWVQKQVTQQNADKFLNGRYIMYEHQAQGLRGSSNRFTKRPVNTSFTTLFDQSTQNQYVEVEIPYDLHIMDSIQMEMDVTFVDGVVGAGTDSMCVIPTDQWIQRVELRGGSSGSGPIDTIEGDTILLERPYRYNHTQSIQAARDLGWGSTDAASYAPRISIAAATQNQGPDSASGWGTLSPKIQINIPNFLTDSKVIGRALGLHNRKMYLRVYLRDNIFAHSLHGTAPSVSVNDVRFWFFEHVLPSQDASIQTQLIARQSFVFKGISRTYFYDDVQTYTDNQDRSKVLTNLRGTSAALLIYLRETSESMKTSSLTASSPDGELAQYHQITKLSLKDSGNSKITEEETEMQNYTSVQLNHVKAPWYRQVESRWKHWLLPFCADFGSVLKGSHTGYFAFSGQETLDYTVGTAPDTAARLAIVSYDYASLVLHPGKEPELQKASQMS